MATTSPTVVNGVNIDQLIETIHLRFAIGVGNLG